MTQPPPPPPPQAKIEHIVVIFQENRTPDNLFHGLPNADIADTGTNSAGQMIPLTPITLANDYDLSHAHSAFVAMYDNGKMDGADKIPIGCKAGATGCPPPNPQFQYVNPSEVQPYFQMAEQYTFADRMFQTNQGPSFPAHQFIISGTSAPTATSNLFASENVVLPPNPGTNTAAGCAGPTGETVALIDPMGSEATRQFPCFEHPTLVDLLDSSGITWKYLRPHTGIDLDRAECDPAPAIWRRLAKGHHPADHRADGHCQRAARPSDLGDSRRARLGSRLVQRRERAFVGGIDCERHWE